MSKRHMLEGEDISHRLYEAMLEYDDDIVVTVHPMRRDSRCASLVAYMYKDGSELVPDPLYAWFCWVDRLIGPFDRCSNVAIEDLPDGMARCYHVDEMVAIRDRLIETLDAEWERDA